VSPLRVAVVQAAPVVFDVPRTLAKLRDLAADAARRGARLAVSPEAFVSAYRRRSRPGAGPLLDVLAPGCQ
jgi:nitrilase